MKSSRRSVIGIILNEPQDQILLIKRRDVPIWVLPGGGVEESETPEKAIVREIQEETGLDVSIKRHVALYTPINRLANDTYVFECVAHSGTLATGDETKDLGFFPLSSLPTPLFFIHREWIEDSLKPQTFPIHKKLTQITYFKLFKYFFCHPLQVIRFFFSRLGLPFNS